jgi:hypothetical protein
MISMLCAACFAKLYSLTQHLAPQFRATQFACSVCSRNTLLRAQPPVDSSTLQRQSTMKRSAQAPPSAAPVGAVDHDNDDFAAFESGAILMYLAEKAGQLYLQDFNKRSEVQQWLLFQNAGIGPMQGQAGHFKKFAPENIAGDGSWKAPETSQRSS